MSGYFFVCAAVLSGLWAMVHIRVGGGEVAAPLRRVSGDALGGVARDTAWLCWHLVTGVLVLLPVLFSGAAAGVDGFGVTATALAGTLATAGLIAAPLAGRSYRELPQGWLFVPVALLGLAGLW